MDNLRAGSEVVGTNETNLIKKDNFGDFIRKLVGWVLLGLILYFFLSQLPNIFHLFKKAKWYWLFIAASMQLGTYWANGIFFANLLEHFKYAVHRLSRSRLFKISLAFNYLNMAVPSWGLAGLFFLAKSFKKDGVSVDKSVAAGVTYYGLSLFSFFLLILFAVGYLIVVRQLTHFQAIATLFVFIFVLTIFLLVLYFSHNPERFKKLLNFLIKPIDKIALIFSKKAEKGNLENGNGTVETVRQLLNIDFLVKELPKRIKSLKEPEAARTMWRSLFYAFLFHFFDMTTLYFLFLAFNFHPAISIVIAGFVLTSIFGFISFIPSAIGVFEASMAFVYAGLGVPFGIAVLVALVYRGLSFWLPMPIGLWIYKELTTPQPHHHWFSFKKSAKEA